MLGIAALTCLHIRWRDAEPGMGWYAPGMGSLALWMPNNARHLPSGPELNPSPWHFVMCLAMGAMGPGLAAYLGLPRRRRLAMLAVVLPSAAFAGIVAWTMISGETVLRIWLHVLCGATMILYGHVASRRNATRREKAVGMWSKAAAVMAGSRSARRWTTKAPA